MLYAIGADIWILLPAFMHQAWLEGPRDAARVYQLHALVLAGATAILIYIGMKWMLLRWEHDVARLRQRELQLDGIVDTTMDAVITVDSNQRIVLFNQAASELFGMPAAQALGQTLDSFLPKRLRQAHCAHVNRFRDDGKTSRSMGRLHTLTGVRADGSEFPMEATISRSGDAAGVLMTVVLRDITHRLETERTQRALFEAQAATQAKSRFLAHISHELRTPLNAIVGFSELVLLRKDRPGADDSFEQVHHIRDAGRHLLTLVEDLLDVTRIESGTLVVRCRHVDLSVQIDEAWRMSAEMARQQGIHLVDSYRAGQVTAWADPVRLRQILLNLISNAVKYNRPGGRIDIQTGCAGDQAQIRVVDTGSGMSPEQLAHLYEPFNRLGQEAGRIEGSGIGLVLSRQLALLMEGTLSVESRPGVGTTAVLSLPLPSSVPTTNSPSTELNV